jgi:hypothetical protein
MNGFPIEWRKDLQYAARRGDDEQLLKLVDAIRQDNQAVAESLTELIRQFRFDRLVSLVDQSMKNLE